MQKSIAAITLGTLTLVSACSRSEHGAMNQAAPVASMAMPSPVHTIALPHDEPELPPGRGRDEFIAQCVICHSPRYVTSQPAFSRKVWTAEVTKMIKVYGAPASPDQATDIVEYLVALNGIPKERKQ